jgi:hypothetical protein
MISFDELFHWNGNPISFFRNENLSVSSMLTPSSPFSLLLCFDVIDENLGHSNINRIVINFIAETNQWDIILEPGNLLNERNPQTIQLLFWCMNFLDEDVDWAGAIEYYFIVGSNGQILWILSKLKRVQSLMRVGSKRFQFNLFLDSPYNKVLLIFYKVVPVICHHVSLVLWEFGINRMDLLVISFQFHFATSIKIDSILTAHCHIASKWWKNSFIHSFLAVDVLTWEKVYWALVQMVKPIYKDVISFSHNKLTAVFLFEIVLDLIHFM